MAATSTPAIDRFLAAASAAGVEVAVQRFPEGTRTAADAAAAIGCEPGAIVKSLVFVAERHDDSRAVVALVSGANRADTGKLARHFDVPSIRQANADEARAATGFAIGGTPPIGHVTATDLVIDEDLLRHELVWAAAGTPDSVWPIEPRRLVEITGAPVVEVKL
jgi:prolyl-tRNA editing enzyme YbaK/EbsC (Cys-tRNA(Pro) deacylase)